jgi:hypothetical protein
MVYICFLCAFNLHTGGSILFIPKNLFRFLVNFPWPIKIEIG